MLLGNNERMIVISYIEGIGVALIQFLFIFDGTQIIIFANNIFEIQINLDQI